MKTNTIYIIIHLSLQIFERTATSLSIDRQKGNNSVGINCERKGKVHNCNFN